MRGTHLTADNEKALKPRLVSELLDIFMLHVLSAKPLCGYELINTIQMDFGVLIGSSRVYPLLHKLDEEGYIRRYIGSWGKRKKVYTITPKGLAFLNSSRDTFCAFMGKVFDIGLVGAIKLVE